LAGLTGFQTVDLPARYGYRPQPPQPIDVAVAQMVANAPPGAIFMLDSRIPLPANGAVSPVKTQQSNGARQPATTFSSILPQAEGSAP
jgi:hypothetical protein